MAWAKTGVPPMRCHCLLSVTYGPTWDATAWCLWPMGPPMGLPEMLLPVVCDLWAHLWAHLRCYCLLSVTYGPTWSPRLRPASAALDPFSTLVMKMPWPRSSPPRMEKCRTSSRVVRVKVTVLTLALAAQAMFSKLIWPIMRCNTDRQQFFSAGQLHLGVFQLQANTPSVQSCSNRLNVTLKWRMLNWYTSKMKKNTLVTVICWLTVE